MNTRVTLILTMWTLAYVRTIVVPEEELLRIEDPSNRELISPDTDAANRELNELSKTVGCLMQFVESYMNQLPSRLSVLLMETDDSDFSSVYLSKLQQVRSTYLLKGDFDSESNQNTSLDALVILKSYEHLENSTSVLIDLCGRDCRYGVVVTSLFPDEESFMAEAENYVELLWRKRVANVVILGAVGDRLLAAQSQGFRANELTEPSAPILIGKCHQDLWTNSTEIYPVLKMNNSIIHFAIIEREPYMNVHQENDEIVIRGIESEIIYILQETMHFQPTGSLLNWSEGTTVEDEILEEFESDRRIDFVVGGLLRTQIKGADFALPYDVTQVVWLVPTSANLSFLGLISPFSMHIWLLTLAAIIFGGMIKFLLFHKMSFLEIVALVIGVAWPKQPKELAYRINFMSWVLFGYILTQYYLASLAGQLLASADLQIDTMEELVDGGFIFGGTTNHKQFFADNAADDEDSASAVNTIFKQFMVLSYEDYMTQLEDLIEGVNASLALVAVLNISSTNKDITHRPYHIVKETLASTPLAFPTWKGLPYLTQIDEILELLIQGGIISFIAKNETSLQHMHDAINESDTTFLELIDIAPIFLFLAMGHLAGVLCLLGELGVFWWHNRQQGKVLTKGNKVRRIKGMTKKTVRFNERKPMRMAHEKGLRQRVLRPNVSFGYYDDRVPWKIV